MTVFDSWYTPTGTGSGIGSTPAYTAGWRAYLERFMREHDICSVLDVGCGDWQHSRLVDWGDRLYVGVEVVPALVERLIWQYGGATRCFTTAIPDSSFDLVICKDVMIHLPNAEVIELLGELQSHGQHVLLANDWALGPATDIKRGEYRALDITAEPFNVDAIEVYRFPQLNRETKVVHHVKGVSCTT